MRNPLGWAPKPLRRALLLLALALIVGYLVLPQLAGARRSLELIREVDPWLLAAAAVLQVAAMLSQAELTRSVLPGATRPGFGDMARIELASTAVSHTVPGGTAAGTALGFRLLTKAGVGSADAGFAVATRGLGSAVVLNVLLWLALVISIPAEGFDPLYSAAAGLGVMLLGGFGALVVLLMRHEQRTSDVVEAIVRRIPLLDADRAPAVVEHLADRLRSLASQPGVLGRAIGWSAAYWLGSAASLWIFLAAFGHRADPVSMMVAFGLANVLAVIPITPRGLGVVEATLIPLLVGFGAARTEATIGVLAWRFVSFWLPIPAGALAYLSLRLVPGAAGEQRRRERQERLSELSEIVVNEAQDVREWAHEHGIGKGSSDSGSSDDDHTRRQAVSRTPAEDEHPSRS